MVVLTFDKFTERTFDYALCFESLLQFRLPLQKALIQVQPLGEESNSFMQQVVILNPFPNLPLCLCQHSLFSSLRFRLHRSHSISIFNDSEMHSFSAVSPSPSPHQPTQPNSFPDFYINTQNRNDVQRNQAKVQQLLLLRHSLRHMCPTQFVSTIPSRPFSTVQKMLC